MSWLKQTKPSKEEFAKTVTKFLENSGERRPIVYDAQEFSLKVREANGGFGSAYYLSNAYSDYCKVPIKDREHLLKNYFSPPEEMPSKLEDASSRILPRFQTRIFFEMMHVQMRQHGQIELPYSLIAEHFGIALVYDGPRNVMYIDKESLDRWKTDFTSLMSPAIANLARLTP